MISSIPNTHSLVKNIGFELWKKNIWPSYTVDFNDYFHWHTDVFAHCTNHNTSLGQTFLNWWFDFAKNSFKQPYEFKKNIVRFLCRQDMLVLTAKLNQPIYYMELENQNSNIKTVAQAVTRCFLQNQTPFDFVVPHSSHALKIYGLDFSQVDELEFKLKFGYFLKSSIA